MSSKDNEEKIMSSVNSCLRLLTVRVKWIITSLHIHTSKTIKWCSFVRIMSLNKTCFTAIIQNSIEDSHRQALCGGTRTLLKIVRHAEYKQPEQNLSHSDCKSWNCAEQHGSVSWWVIWNTDPGSAGASGLCSGWVWGWRAPGSRRWTGCPRWSGGTGGWTERSGGTGCWSREGETGGEEDTFHLLSQRVSQENNAEDERSSAFNRYLWNCTQRLTSTSVNSALNTA